MTILLFPVSGPPLSHAFLVNSETHPEAACGCHSHQARVAAVESEYQAQGAGLAAGTLVPGGAGWECRPRHCNTGGPSSSRVKWALHHRPCRAAVTATSGISNWEHAKNHRVVYSKQVNSVSVISIRLSFKAACVRPGPRRLGCGALPATARLAGALQCASPSRVNKHSSGFHFPCRATKSKATNWCSFFF